MKRIDNVSWAICKIFEDFDDAKEWSKILGPEKAVDIFNREVWCIINADLFDESERRGLVTLKDSLRGGLHNESVHQRASQA